jgi:hypothetical protein
MTALAWFAPFRTRVGEWPEFALTGRLEST